jgi:AraC-like DNA-binding protein
MRRYVESIWFARGTVPYARERIAPTGSTVAVMVLGDAIIETPDDGHGQALRAQRGFLIGPHDRPVINEPTGETFAVGIVCTPVGCTPALGVVPGAVRSRVVDLESTWPAATDLRARLLDGGDPSGMLAMVERYLAGSAQPSIVGFDRCQRAVAMLETDPTRPVADIAAALDISHGHLDREFTRIVGLGPRVLARLLRMRRLLEAIDVAGDVPWAGVAAELGWFDQAHLIRDFRRHTGVTPTQYVAAQRAAFAPRDLGSAAGFVPQVDARGR